MNQSTQPSKENVWSMIESERKRDRLVRRLSVIAWTVTLGVMLVFAAIVGAEVVRTLDLVGQGVATNRDVVDRLVPLLGVVGVTSLLLALVSTAAVFLRFRTASLGDIQLRLASLEAALSDEG
jgi:hypothetical protein